MDWVRATVDGRRYVDATDTDGVWWCEAACASVRGDRLRQEDAALLGDMNGCIRVQGENETVVPMRRFDVPSLFVVADGMGGHPAGDLASGICIGNLSELFERPDRIQKLSSAVAAVQHAIEESATEMNWIGRGDASKSGMGATMVLLAACIDGCAILHIGDCRAYTFRKCNLKRLTRDDTEGQRLLDLGLLEQNEIDRHPDRDRLTRYIGKNSSGLILRAHEGNIEIDNQIILLCSDGVSRALPSKEIMDILNTSESVDRQCQRIVEEAKQRGSTDNMTALLIRIEK